MERKKNPVRKLPPDYMGQDGPNDPAPAGRDLANHAYLTTPKSSNALVVGIVVSTRQTR